MAIQSLLLTLVVALISPTTASGTGAQIAVPNCGRKYTHGVPGKIKIIMQRRGGGITNGKRWIAYYVETQVPLEGDGPLNRAGSKGVLQRTNCRRPVAWRCRPPRPCSRSPGRPCPR